MYHYWYIRIITVFKGKHWSFDTGKQNLNYKDSMTFVVTINHEST